MGDGTDTRLVIAVVNLKGGTAKTTTAVFLAHTLRERGRRVLLVDADPQGSAQSWNEDAPDPFPFPVVGLATRDLHRQLPGFVNTAIDAVVIDTPPLDQRAGIVGSALRAATVVVVPVAPTPMEYKRLASVTAAVQDAASLRPDGDPVPLAVVLTRTVANATSTVVWRDQITADGLWCLRAEVRRLERFAQADGDNVVGAADTAYGEVIDELFAGRAAA